MADTSKLNTSKLGTKEYWNSFYNLEKQNFEVNPQDTGECWFEDNDAEEKMVNFLIDNLNEQKISQKSRIIDLGTGNGHLLFSLSIEGFNGDMIGVDYSEKSIEFSKEILSTQYSHYKHISFDSADIFDKNWVPGRFDIVLDKGTLDAIALSGIEFENGNTAVDLYPHIIERLMENNSIFLITSCNFTQKELIKLIETEHLKMWKTIDYPSFEFNGVKGTAVCTVAFIKYE